MFANPDKIQEIAGREQAKEKKLIERYKRMQEYKKIKVKIADELSRQPRVPFNINYDKYN